MNNPNEVRCERPYDPRLPAPRPSASAYWAGYLKCYDAAQSILLSDAKRIAELEGCIAALRKDAERYKYARGRLIIGEHIVGWDKEPRFVQWSRVPM